MFAMSNSDLLFLSDFESLFLIIIFSTISSGLNAVSAVMLEDYVKPIFCKKISPERATLLSKAFGKSPVL